MYNCCNSCGASYCASAINTLKQIAALVCGTNQTDGGNGSGHTCGCCCNGQTGNYYSFPVSGRVYVSSGGWCNGDVNIVLNTNGQTATPYSQTTSYGQTNTFGYGTNGVYGGTSRRCGCAFNALNS